MNEPPHIPIADHRTELVASVMCLLHRQLPAGLIAYVLPEQNRILFRTVGGRTFDVELLINWDVVQSSIAQNAAGTNCSAPAPTESDSQP